MLFKSIIKEVRTYERDAGGAVVKEILERTVTEEKEEEEGKNKGD